MGMCGGAWWGPKAEMLKRYCFYYESLKRLSRAGACQPNEQVYEPDRPGRGSGRVNPAPRRLVWSCCVGLDGLWLVGASPSLEPRGLG